MSKTLTEIAQQLCTSQPTKQKVQKARDVGPVPKVQLIFAFNGMGKTRLSREFKELIAPKNDADGEKTDHPRSKVLYYNAFTEDLFYWDNDLENDAAPKLKIHPNTFTKWVLEDQGQDQNIIAYFRHYTSEKLTPRFNEAYESTEKTGKIRRTYTIKAFSEVTFSFARGDNLQEQYIKLSKGEESSFIWAVFYSLLTQAISELNITEADERSTDVFNSLEYVFIDDPVSSLDENHLIELAVNLASVIKSSNSAIKFIITTHNTLFYNVLHNELKTKTCYLLERHEDGTFSLIEKQGDSNKSFSYHLHILQVIEQAITENRVERYHFTLLRNLYEKTASFLGYPKWAELLPEDKQAYLSRIIQFTSHNTLSHETVAEPSPAEKARLNFCLII